MSFPALMFRAPMFRAYIAAVVLLTLGAITAGPTVAEAQTIADMKRKLQEESAKAKEESAKAKEESAKAKDCIAKAEEESAKAKEGIAKAEQENAIYTRINNSIQQLDSCITEIDHAIANKLLYQRDSVLQKKVVNSVECAEVQSNFLEHHAKKVEDAKMSNNIRLLTAKTGALISRAKSEFDLK